VSEPCSLFQEPPKRDGGGLGFHHWRSCGHVLPRLTELGYTANSVADARFSGADLLGFAAC